MLFQANVATASNVPPTEILNQMNNGSGDSALGINFDIGGIVSSLNYFALAWCIIYGFLLVSDFYFWRVKYSNLEIPRMKRGETSIFSAAKIWSSYLLLSFFYILYTVFYENVIIANIFGMFLATGYIVKLVFDLTLIPVLNTVPNKIIEATKKAAKAVTPEFGKKEK